MLANAFSYNPIYNLIYCEVLSKTKAVDIEDFKGIVLTIGKLC